MSLHTLFAVNANRKWSKRYSEMYTLIEFIDPDSGKLYRTYISDSNYNSQNWDELIEHMRLHEDQVAVIEGWFKPKRGHPDIINADSKFQIITQFDRDVVMNEVWDNFYA